MVWTVRRKKKRRKRKRGEKKAVVELGFRDLQTDTPGTGTSRSGPWEESSWAVSRRCRRVYMII
jgi:hypothetical protein